MNRLEEYNTARRVIDSYKEWWKKNDEDGKNWSFHYQMDELRNSVWQGVRFLPNLKEITAEEFAGHPAISGSYGAELLSSSSCEYLPGIVYTRYARVMMVGVQSFAGHGVAFVAVPKKDTKEEWAKSQHNTVEQKLRYWSFHICAHEFRNVISLHPRNCVHTYRCAKCDWTFEVDSSG